MTNLSGAQCVAVILTQLDERRVQSILAHMSDADAIRIMSEIARLPAISGDDVRVVISEFVAEAGDFVQVRQGGMAIAERLLRERLGPQRAAEVMAELRLTATDAPLAFLSTIDPAQIAAFMADEHPQTVALVLSNIYDQHAARVLEQMDQTLAADIIRRMATLGPVPLETLTSVADALQNRLWDMSRAAMYSTSGGVSAAAAVLNNVERGADREILRRIEESDPALAEVIRDEMFVFDDISALEDAAIQTIVRIVPFKDLAVALKTASHELTEKVRRNMSDRALADLDEETQSLGAQLLSRIEEAQARVVKAVRALIDDGTIMIQRADDELIA